MQPFLAKWERRVRKLLIAPPSQGSYALAGLTEVLRQHTVSLFEAAAEVGHIGEAPSERNLTYGPVSLGAIPESSVAALSAVPESTERATCLHQRGPNLRSARLFRTVAIIAASSLGSLKSDSTTARMLSSHHDSRTRTRGVVHDGGESDVVPIVKSIPTVHGGNRKIRSIRPLEVGLMCCLPFWMPLLVGDRRSQ
jgi:hypothetical protein